MSNDYDWFGGDPGVKADLGPTVTTEDPGPLLPALGHEIPVYRTDRVSRATWLKRRTGTIGASQIAAIMQRHPYSSPIQAWAQITGRRRQDTDDEDELFRMELGTVCEPQIRQVAADALEVPLLSPGVTSTRYMTAWPQVLRHPRLSMFTCNLDAVLFDGERRMPVECKWTNWRNRDAWHELRETRDAQSAIGTSVFAYVLQVQAQLSITGLSRGILIGIIGEDAANRLLVNALTKRVGIDAFDPKDRDVVIVYIDRDEGMIDAIERVVPRFHAKFIAGGDIPPVTDRRDLEALRQAYRESHPRVLIDRPDLEPLCERYLALGAKLSHGESLRDDTKARIMHAITSAGISECSAGRHKITYNLNKGGKRTLRITGPKGEA